MASRTRSGHTGSNAARAASIDDLPDVLLERVLGFLPSLKEQQRAALVSRRFAAAACSPDLLRELHFGEVKGLPAMRSLAAWLARHGGRAQHLMVRFTGGEQESEASVAAAVTACLTAASAAGQLASLAAYGYIYGSEWLPAMASLRRLKLTAWLGEPPLDLSPAISCLTALDSLTLTGNKIDLAEAARLPASLTHLHLSQYAYDTMPQVFHMTQLARLELKHCYFTAESTFQLANLAHSLTRLELDASHVPHALPALLQLRHLSIRGCEDPNDPDGVIKDTLPRLTQLTCLMLEVGGIALPAQMPHLPHLQRCYLESWDMQALPQGPWLASLRWLGTQIEVLSNSVAALRGAAALEHVGGKSYSRDLMDWASPAAAAFFGWLARHPPLQHAHFHAAGHTTAFDSQEFAAHLARLCPRRPGLEVHCTGSEFGAFDSTTFLDLINQD